MEAIHFVDTTIRDGHQSLWAENMTTGMMLPIAKNMDNAGFEGIELIAGSHLKKTVRELREDPWERVRLITKEITKTPLRVISGRWSTITHNSSIRFPAACSLICATSCAKWAWSIDFSKRWRKPSACAKSLAI